MRFSKTFGFTASLVLVVGLCSLSLPPGDDKPKNLKVLPKNTTSEQLDDIMKGFKNALGVKCSFCHVPSKEDPKKLDFASDNNEHKLVARSMMKMTMRINKKYFKGHEGSGAVTCFTCHHGNEEPKSAPVASN